MKKLIVLLITILLGHLSYSQSKSYKQEQIESF